MMVSYPGLPSDEPHEESPDCRGQGCIPLERLQSPRQCKNPNHALTDGTPSPHEIGTSCMSEAAQDAPTKNCEHERVDEDGYCRKCGSDTRGGFCLAQDAPQPQSDERRNALESLSPGRTVNAAQTDWGKGYIEGWVARAKSQG